MRASSEIGTVRHISRESARRRVPLKRPVLPCTRRLCAPSAAGKLRMVVPCSYRTRRSRVKLCKRILVNQVSRCKGLYRGETTNLRYEPPCGPRDWCIFSAVFQTPRLPGLERVEFGLWAGGLRNASVMALPARQLLRSSARCRSASSRRGSHTYGWEADWGRRLLGFDIRTYTTTYNASTRIYDGFVVDAHGV